MTEEANALRVGKQDLPAGDPLDQIGKQSDTPSLAKIGRFPQSLRHANQATLVDSGVKEPTQGQSRVDSHSISRLAKGGELFTQRSGYRRVIAVQSRGFNKAQQQGQNPLSGAVADGAATRNLTGITPRTAGKFSVQRDMTINIYPGHILTGCRV